jgi:hypothetical protein
MRISSLQLLPVWHLERVAEAGLLVERGVGVQVLFREPLREGRGQVGEGHDLLPFLGCLDLSAGEEDVDGAYHATRGSPARWHGTLPRPLPFPAHLRPNEQTKNTTVNT